MSRVLWSLQALRMMSVMLDGRRVHGSEVCRQAKLSKGVGFDILERFVGLGYFTSERERVDQANAPRVPRLFFQITDRGRAAWSELRAVTQRRAA